MWSSRHPVTLLVVLALVWWVTYQSLLPAARQIVELLPIDAASSFGQSLEFFLYDTPKVLMLLSGIVFVMGIVNTYFTPERTRTLLMGRGKFWANAMAAGLGAVTPFCSCSSVPLFIGFVKAGIPLGVTFSFLIASPLVGPIALALLYSLFGWQITLLFALVGIVLAIAGGLLIGAMNLENYLEDWVQDVPNMTATEILITMRLGERIAAGAKETRNVVGKVWPYVLLGIGVGAGIHGYVPEEMLMSVMGKDASWWAVPVSVLIGVPMYANPAGILPIVQALTSKGVAMGTALAFMMSVITLSLPEMIILRKVLKLRLIAVFVATVTMGILIVGYLFNAIL
jgi:uncharacterized protein